eukprot:2776015-Pyramimonas_sp.AAC.1
MFAYPPCLCSHPERRHTHYAKTGVYDATGYTQRYDSLRSPDVDRVGKAYEFVFVISLRSYLSTETLL